MLKYRQMSVSEQKDELWGRSWISESLATYIDFYIQSGDNDRRKIEAIAEKILYPLSIRGIPNEVLNCLGIKFVNSEQRNPRPESSGVIKRIEAIVTEEFGTEMLNRLDFSIEGQKIRTFERKKTWDINH